MTTIMKLKNKHKSQSVRIVRALSVSRNSPSFMEPEMLLLS